MRVRQDIRKDIHIKQNILANNKIGNFREGLADLKLIGWGRVKSLTGGSELPPHSGFLHAN